MSYGALSAFSSGCGAGRDCRGAFQGLPAGQRCLPTMQLREWGWKTILENLCHAAGTCSHGEGQGRRRKGAQDFLLPWQYLFAIFYFKEGKDDVFTSWRDLWKVSEKSFKSSSLHILSNTFPSVSVGRGEWHDVHKGRESHPTHLVPLQSCWKSRGVLAGCWTGPSVTVLVRIAQLTPWQETLDEDGCGESITVSSRQHQPLKECIFLYGFERNCLPTWHSRALRVLLWVSALCLAL